MKIIKGGDNILNLLLQVVILTQLFIKNQSFCANYDYGMNSEVIQTGSKSENLANLCSDPFQKIFYLKVYYNQAFKITPKVSVYVYGAQFMTGNKIEFLFYLDDIYKEYFYLKIQCDVYSNYIVDFYWIAYNNNSIFVDSFYKDYLEFLSDTQNFNFSIPVKSKPKKCIAFLSDFAYQKGKIRSSIFGLEVSIKSVIDKRITVSTNLFSQQSFSYLEITYVCILDQKLQFDYLFTDYLQAYQNKNEHTFQNLELSSSSSSQLPIIFGFRGFKGLPAYLQNQIYRIEKINQTPRQNFNVNIINNNQYIFNKSEIQVKIMTELNQDSQFVSYHMLVIKHKVCKGELPILYDNSDCIQTCDENPSKCYPCQNQLNYFELLPNACQFCPLGVSPETGQCLSHKLDINNKFQKCLTCAKCTLNSINLECKGCHSSCLTCNGATSKDCLICSKNYFKFQQMCVQQCPKFYSKVNNECVKCPSNCSICSDGSTCTVCFDGMYLNSITKQCIQCNLECKTCQDSINCNECGAGYFKYQDKCVSKCPQGTYNFQNTCNKCLDKCAECSDYNPCLKCDSGYYLDSSDSQCKQCHLSCELCSGQGYESCQKCSSNYYLYKNSCLDQCPGGYSKNLQFRMCQNNNCQNNQYYDFSQSICQNCSIICKDCYGKTDLDCINCTTGYFKFQENQCLNQCPPRFYGSETICIECPEHCKVCNSQNYCIECDDRFFAKEIQNNDNQCQQCSFGCLKCSGDQQNECTQCLDEFFMIDGNTCLPDCPSGYEKDLSKKSCNKCQDNQIFIDNKCQNCHLTCQTCFDITEFSCINCQPNLYLNMVSKSCAQDCPIQTYKNDSKCIECMSNCKQCSDDQSCEYCSDNYFINSSYQCESCDSSCVQCSGPSNKDCIKCREGFFKHIDNTCVQSCPKGFYNENDQCLKCKNECLACENYSKCSSCILGYFILEDDQNNQVLCEKCDSSCQTCQGISNTDCLSCYPNFSLAKNKKCLKGCEDNTFEVTCYCSDCKNYKSSCSNPQFCYTCTNPEEVFSYCSHCDPSKQLFQLPIESSQCSFCPIRLKETYDECERYYFEERNYVEKCSVGYYLQQDGVNCFKCEENAFINNAKTKCLQCDASCNGCTGVSNSECKKCALRYLNLEKSCVKECPISYFEDQGQCIKCIEYCSTCSDSQTCLVCQAAYFLHETICISQCPIGYYPQFTDFNATCLKCKENCTACGNEYECFECQKDYTLKDQQCISEQKLKEDIELKNFTQPLLNPQQVQSVQSSVQASSSGFALAAILGKFIQNLNSNQFVLFQKGNPQILLSFIDILQMLSYILFININYPPEVEEFFKMFKDIQLGLIPNPLSSIEFQRQNAPSKFKLEDQGVNFIENSIQYIQVLCFLIALYIIFYTLEKLSKTYQKITDRFQYLRKSLEWGYFLALIQASFLTLSIFAFLQLSNSSCYQLNCYLSFLLSAFTLKLLIFSLFLTVIIVQFVLRSENLSKQFEKQYGVIYTFLKTDNFLSAGFQVIMMIRKMLFAFFLVYLQKQPGIQLLFINILSFIVFMLLLTQSPFKSSIDFYKEVLTEFLYMVIHFISKDLIDENISKIERTRVGKIIVFSIILILIVHVICMIIETYAKAREVIEQIKQWWKNRKQKQQAIVKSVTNNVLKQAQDQSSVCQLNDISNQ